MHDARHVECCADDVSRGIDRRFIEVLADLVVEAVSVCGDGDLDERLRRDVEGGRYQQGCGQGAYVISSKVILGGTASMVYSPSCQTNWLEWHGPYRQTNKQMYQPVATAAEADTATWSYSRQVYAPGATVARGEIWVWVDNTGYNGAQGWSVRCGSTCEWVQFS